MTGAVVGLLFGLGVCCVWWSFWPRPVRPPGDHTRRLEVRDDLVLAGFPTATPARLAGACVAAAGTAMVLAWVGTRVLPIAVIFGALVGYLPLAVVRSRARSRRRALREVWPDVVDNLASAVRAGLSLPEAIAQIGSRGPHELRPAFCAFGEDYRATGRFSFCLDRLKASLADPVADRLVESLRIARDVGGSDLGRLLRTLSAFLREDAQTRAELEARQSWTVNAARLAVAAPWLVLGMLATRPESVRAYSSVAGAVVLLAGTAVSLVAYRLMSVLARLPDDERVLR
ncbi:MAG: type II secretion system F family protein [Austwickia sp.]|jgi:tight adherence protein B|nr:MAG: type II secretion system F family protein [Austwickia sp.]